VAPAPCREDMIACCVAACPSVLPSNDKKQFRFFGLIQTLIRLRFRLSLINCLGVFDGMLLMWVTTVACVMEQQKQKNKSTKVAATRPNRLLYRH